MPRRFCALRMSAAMIWRHLNKSPWSWLSIIITTTIITIITTITITITITTTITIITITRMMLAGGGACFLKEPPSTFLAARQLR